MQSWWHCESSCPAFPPPSKWTCDPSLNSETIFHDFESWVEWRRNITWSWINFAVGTLKTVLTDPLILLLRSCDLSWFLLPKTWLIHFFDSINYLISLQWIWFLNWPRCLQTKNPSFSMQKNVLNVIHLLERYLGEKLWGDSVLLSDTLALVYFFQTHLAQFFFIHLFIQLYTPLSLHLLNIYHFLATKNIPFRYLHGKLPHLP